MTNDGITYRYSHTKFTYVGDCLPTKVRSGHLALLSVLTYTRPISNGTALSLSSDNPRKLVP